MIHKHDKHQKHKHDKEQNVLETTHWRMLFKSTRQARVVRKVDNAINRINH